MESAFFLKGMEISERFSLKNVLRRPEISALSVQN